MPSRLADAVPSPAVHPFSTCANVLAAASIELQTLQVRYALDLVEAAPRDVARLFRAPLQTWPRLAAESQARSVQRGVESANNVARVYAETGQQLMRTVSRGLSTWMDGVIPAGSPAADQADADRVMAVATEQSAPAPVAVERAATSVRKSNATAGKGSSSRRRAPMFAMTERDGGYAFDVLDGAGTAILSSGRYANKPAARKGVDAVTTNAVNAARYRRSDGSDDSWSFKVVAGNNRKLAESRGYDAEKAMEADIAYLQRRIAKAKVQDTAD